MASRIIIKNSSTASAVPVVGDLALGELAINTNDGKLFLKKDNGAASIVEIGGSGSGVWRGDSPPSDKVAYPQWIDTTSGLEYTWYEDGTSNQWVQTQDTSQVVSLTQDILDLSVDLTPQLGGDLDGNDFDMHSLKNVTFLAETANTGTTQTINWNNNQKQKTTITAATGITFTAPAGPCNLVLKIVNGGLGTITWPASVIWPNGDTEPTWSSADTDIASFYYDGTNYYGMAWIA